MCLNAVNEVGDEPKSLCSAPVFGRAHE
jgi:hypothetical protein